MQSTAHSAIKAAFTALIKSFFPGQDTNCANSNTKAYRIGPQRVILRVDLNDNFKSLHVDQVSIVSPTLQQRVHTPNVEKVSVELVIASDESVTSQPVKRWHQVTLKVQPATTRLTLNFKNSVSAVHSVQHIDIQ
jgi:hypothetical protein